MIAGAVYAALGVLDPRLPLPLLGPALAILGLVLARRRGDRRPAALVLTVLTCVYALAGRTEPDFAADSPSYFVYLRSAAFDHDLDFANEWAEWGYEEQPLTATGHRRNVHAIGSALVWSPFYAAAHAYVRATRLFGSRAYAADGYAIPYVRATVLGTATVVVLGAFLLFRALVPFFGATLAAVGVLTGTLASPIPYYVFLQPTMAHGIVYGLAALFVWAWIEAARAPSARAFARLGLLLGLLVLTRWQAIV
jgi:hypothetical protein